MPGALTPNARCPKCGRLLLAVSRLVSSDQTTIDYYHEKPARGFRRRRRRCQIKIAGAYTGKGYGRRFEAMLG